MTYATPDSALSYGTISRLFHWTMAACFVVVFTAALTHFLADGSAIERFVWPAHKPTGALLMLLVLLRASWALTHRSRRPSAVNAAAHWGHRFLYSLMFAIPVLALLRQYGSGNAFAPFGVTIMAQRVDDKIEWMLKLGGLLHGELGWILLASIVGHIVMALWHRRHPESNVMPRMLG
jgi:cytochrome b561